MGVLHPLTLPPRTPSNPQESLQGTTPRILTHFDPATGRVLCLAGFVNDPLDESKENARWEYINGKLFLRATRDIRPNEQIFAHYGYAYWAWLSDRWPLHLLLQIIDRCLPAVNLLDPVWTRLPDFPTLRHKVHGTTPIPSGLQHPSLPCRSDPTTSHTDSKNAPYTVSFSTAPLSRAPRPPTESLPDTNNTRYDRNLRITP